MFPLEPRRWLPFLVLLVALGLAYGEGLAGWRAIDGAALIPYVDPLYAPSESTRAPGLHFDATPGMYNQPWDTLAWQLMRTGQLPLWQPHSAFGIPLLGSGQSCPFNPFKLLLAGGAHGLAEAWFLVMRLAFGGLGMLVLARALGLGVSGALLASLAFVFNASFSYRFTHSDTSAWVMLPWLLWLGEQLLARPSLRSTAAFGLAIGLTGLMGHPEPALFAAAAAVGVVLMGLLRPGAARTPVLVALVGAGMLGVGLAACTLLPFFELYRTSDSYLADTATRDRVTSLYTLAYKANQLVMHLFSATARPLPFNYNSFAGAVVLALLPFGLLSAQVRRPALGLLAMTVLVLLTCPPGQHLAILPIAPNSFYITVLITFAVALLGGAGLDRLLASPRAWPTTAAAFAAFGLAALTLRFHLRAQTLGPGYGDFRLFTATAACLGVALLLLRFFPRPATALIILLAAGELVWGARVANPPLPRFAYTPTPITTYLQAQPGPFRVTGTVRALIPHTAIMHGLDSIDCVEVFFSKRYVAYIRALLPAGHIMDGGWGVQGPFRPELLDLANVRYMLVPDDTEDAALLRQFARYPALMHDAHVTLRENPTVMPRAWVAYQADFMPVNPEAAGRRLAATPARWRERVLLETSSGQPPTGWQEVGLPAGQARFVTRGAQSVTLEAAPTHPGWLVLADAYYPGWEAEVDGRPAEILPANVAFRAVRLEAGPHRIIFRYAPASASRGLAVS